MCPWPSLSTCSASSPCARLSRAPSTTGGSDFHNGVGLPMDGPFSWPTRSITHRDRHGSPRFRDSSFSVRAVLSDPAGVSSSLAFCGSLLLPSKFSTLSASGCSSDEAQSLHLRYSPDIALPTLSPCRYLHEPKARFQVEGLILLAWAGISPAGSAQLILAHRKILECPGRAPSSPFSSAVPCTGHPALDAGCALVGTRTKSRESPPRKWRSTPRPRPAGRSYPPAPALRAVFAARRSWRCTPYVPASLGTLLASTFRKGPGDCSPVSRRNAATSPRPRPARLPSSMRSRPCTAFRRYRCGAEAP